MIKPLQFFVPPGNDGIIGINAAGVDIDVIERKRNTQWSIHWHIRIPTNFEDALKKFRGLDNAKAHANKLYKAWVWSLMEKPLT